MKRLLITFMLLLAAAAASTVWLARGEAVPALDGDCPLYLTWRGDPTTTITIVWLCREQDAPEPAVFYRASGDGAWQLAKGTGEDFPHTAWQLHRVELTGLAPGTLHHFMVAGEGRLHSFRTLPATLERPVRFVEGGDVGKDFEVMDRVNQRAASVDPDFAVWGGDLAYCDGDPAKAWRWWRFFQSVHRHLRTSDGRLVPLVVTPGNHELPRDGGAADCYLALFPAADGRSYGALDAGDYLSLLLLDTGHLAEIAGAQTDWLAAALAQRRARPHVFPVYHRGAYPSVREFDNRHARAVRGHWVPLFEKHGVRLAFEHHDHTYKVTPALREGRPDETGVVYVGDGAWGADTRAVRPDASYLRRSGSLHHFHEVTLEPHRRTVRSVAADGTEIDRFEQAVGAGG